MKCGRAPQRRCKCRRIIVRDSTMMMGSSAYFLCFEIAICSSKYKTKNRRRGNRDEMGKGSPKSVAILIATLYAIFPCYSLITVIKLLSTTPQLTVWLPLFLKLNKIESISTTFLFRKKERFKK
jgi:hypothetical protein